MSKCHIALSVSPEHLAKIGLVELGDIVEGDLFTRLTDACIKIIEDGCKFIDECLSPPVDEASFFDHLIFPELQQGCIEEFFFIFQQYIPLMQSLGISDQCAQVLLIELGYGHIQKFPPTFTPTGYQFAIGRGDHHKGN
ncbi:hypothetical protein SDC9_186037 [bioreactor metagenome]|uniref:Uncharacterized protein n=1 Tax=bioreactor metagenome TaxID=1076179 RepID=A0A645HT00_9ZZZZ